MTVVHEQVHQRAGKQQQVGQQAQRVRTVFGEQQEAADGQKAVKDPARALPGSCVIVLRRVHFLFPLSSIQLSGAAQT